MPFQSGVPLPPSTWRDYEQGTSLASDIARLIGGGLTNIGGIQRKERADALERQDRLAREERIGSQFDRQLAQSDEHFNISREDKYRLEELKQAQGNGWTLDENDEPVWTGGNAPVDYTPPKVSVPAAKAAGARYQQRYGADMMDVDSPPTAHEQAAMKAGGFFPGNGIEQPRPPATALAGSRVPPLAVQRESRIRKEQAGDNKARDASLAVSQEHLAIARRAETERQAKERNEAEDFQLSDDVNRGMYDTTPVFAKDVRRDAQGKPAPVYKTAAGAEYAARAFSKKQAEDEREKGAQDALIARLKTYEGKIQPGSPYARDLITHGPDGKPLPSKQLQDQLNKLESNLDAQTKAEVAARRRAEVDARRSARDAIVDAARAGKATVDQITTEAQMVERDIETMIDTTDPFKRAELPNDETFKGLLRARADLAAAKQKAQGAAVAPPAPQVGGAPPGLRKAVSSMPATFPSKAAATKWFAENSAGLSDDERAFLESKVAQKVVR